MSTTDNELSAFGRAGCYIERDGVPVPATRSEWLRDYETRDRQIAYALLPGGVYVSTVWLGTDHNFTPDGPPLLYETMTFKHDYTEWNIPGGFARYATRAEAVAGHGRAVVAARRKLRWWRRVGRKALAAVAAWRHAT